MWGASLPFLEGPPPWPPRRPRPGDPRPDPRDLVRVKPWLTLRGLARATCRDQRLQMVVERFATYAGADPRRAPAALAVAGYVEHAFGAWHVRGGLYAIVEALVARLGAGRRRAAPARARAGASAGARSTRTPAASERPRSSGTATPSRSTASWDAAGRRARERSLSGLAVMLALRGREPGLVHHELRFPADYDAELDDVFCARRPVRDPALYLSASCATDPSQAPADGENRFVLVNASVRRARPTGRLRPTAWSSASASAIASWTAPCARPPISRRETGAIDGAIYGDAPHGRLGTLRRPGPRVRGMPGLWRVGGTAHPGGGLPLVLLGAASVAREIGSAPSHAPSAP